MGKVNIFWLFSLVFVIKLHFGSLYSRSLPAAGAEADGRIRGWSCCVLGSGPGGTGSPEGGGVGLASLMGTPEKCPSAEAQQRHRARRARGGWGLGAGVEMSWHRRAGLGQSNGVWIVFSLLSGGGQRCGCLSGAGLVVKV